MTKAVDPIEPVCVYWWPASELRLVTDVRNTWRGARKRIVHSRLGAGTDCLAPQAPETVRGTNPGGEICRCGRLRRQARWPCNPLVTPTGLEPVFSP